MWKRFLKLFGYTESDYKKIRMLGEGGYGKVYLVENKNTGNRYAMKIYFSKSKKNAEKQFSNLLKLKYGYDKYFVRPIRIIKDGFKYAILIEYLKGYKSLLEFLNDTPIINDIIKIKIAKKLIIGLKLLHSLGMAHRDIKPENIMIKSNDRNVDIKYIDFGSACDRITCVNNFSGTREYEAPEVGYFPTTLDQYKRADLYSLGLVISFLFAGSDWRAQAPYKYIKNIPDRNALANRKLIQEPLDNPTLNLLNYDSCQRHF